MILLGLVVIAQSRDITCRLITLLRRNAEINIDSELRLFVALWQHCGPRPWFLRSRPRNTMFIVRKVPISKACPRHRKAEKTTSACPPLFSPFLAFAMPDKCPQ
jgi:hypothetical protein